MLMALECSAAWQPEHVAPRMLHRMFKDGREKAEKFLCVPHLQWPCVTLMGCKSSLL